ncbi:Pentatricopeptide repeat-containing protein [Diplonema papillatum]|nr:Pentatricopeptide repeat-containing protein [Diplonema papillatum]
MAVRAAAMRSIAARLGGRRAVWHMCRGRGVHNQAEAYEIDWGMDVPVQGPTEPRTKPARDGWGTTSSKANKTLDEEIRELDLVSGPGPLKNLLVGPHNPHPLDVFRAIVSRSRTAKIKDHALCVLLLRSRELISRAKNTKHALTELNKAKTIFFDALRNQHFVGVSTNTALMMCFCAAGRTDEAERTFTKMREQNMRPTAHAYEALIRAYCNVVGPIGAKEQALSRAWTILDDMAHNAQFEREDALRLSLSMAASSMLHGAARAKKGDDAEKVWDIIVNRWKIEPNIFMYTNYIKALSATGQGYKGLTVFEELKNKGVTPNTHTYVAVLGALASKDGSVDAIEQAEMLMSELAQHKIAPNIHLYTTLLQVYEKRSEWHGMKLVYIRLRKLKLVPTSVTWNVIATACVRAVRDSPDKTATKIMLKIWDFSRHGIVTRTGERGKSFATGRLRTPGPPHALLLLSLLRGLTAAYEAEAVTEIVEYLEGANLLYTHLCYAPVVKSLTMLGRQEMLEKIEAESQKRTEEREDRLRNSQRPRDVARRKKAE